MRKLTRTSQPSRKALGSPNPSTAAIRHPGPFGWFAVCALALITACGADGPDAALTEARATHQSEQQVAVTERVEDPGWYDSAVDFRGRTGERIVWECGPGPGPAELVWGTDIYSDDSFVCWAAVHAGALKVGEPAAIVIEILPGQSSYRGSERNGVVSMDWNTPWGGSFRVIGRE